MYDEKGVQSWAAELDIYGTVKNLQGERSDCPFRYPGQYEDTEIGLYYNRFRYYDSECGEYVSQDPIGLLGGINLLNYTSDPTIMVDFFGLTSSFADLMDAAKNSLDFSTAKNGAVFWSGDNMKTAQMWAKANGKTTLEQTKGGKYLESLNLFDPKSGLTPTQAAEVWDAASKRFADGASGKVHVFSTGAKKMNAFGKIRTWWRIEKIALMENKNVTEIIRMKKDGKKSKIGGCKK